MSRPLLENLPEIATRVGEATRLLLFLDYDGTLTPIVARPDGAQLTPETRETLDSLARSEDIFPAIISGRALGDVRARVQIPHLIYAGNHGLEICGRGLRFVEPTASAQREELQRLCGTLVTRLAHIPGAEVENKGLTASVHFRRAAPGAEGKVFAIAEAEISRWHNNFLLRTGKKTCEIRPRVDWHKGSAVHWIIARLGQESALSTYIGDDVTDEDAFAALPEGITVKVGDFAKTAAAFHLASPAEVGKFLHWLQTFLKESSRWGGKRR
jgi:trehalose-phosphatase